MPRFAVVTTFSRAVLAQVAAQALRKRGIESRLEHAALRVHNEAASRLLRRVRLLVPEPDYARARAVLGLGCVRGGSAGERVGLGRACPECGHSAPVRARMRSWFSRPATFRCESCGHWWEHVS